MDTSRSAENVTIILPSIAKLGPFEKKIPEEHFKVYNECVALIDADPIIGEVNQLIHEYNQKSTTISADKKTGLLKKVQEKIKELQCKFPALFYTMSPAFHKTQAALFTAIKKLGQPLCDDSSSPLTKLIANMAPPKADALASILTKNPKTFQMKDILSLYCFPEVVSEFPEDRAAEVTDKRTIFFIHKAERWDICYCSNDGVSVTHAIDDANLISRFKQGDSLSDMVGDINTYLAKKEIVVQVDDPYMKEAVDFKDFWSKHQISFLGGGNSYNFKVSNTSPDSEPYELVLKIDNRLDSPRNIEQSLLGDEELKKYFSPVYADRPVIFHTSTDEVISRTLRVTDFCTGGSLFDERIKLDTEGKKTAEKLQIVSDRFLQMVDIMSDLQRKGYLFPDAKATNWLVQGGKLVIADTKSFLRTDDKGNYDSSHPDNLFTDLKRTPGFEPPECESNVVNADRVHAFILGKNIEYLLTKYELTTQQGKQLKILIDSLVKIKPEDRLSIKEAQISLFIITNPEVCKAFNDLESVGKTELISSIKQFLKERLFDADGKRFTDHSLEKEVHISLLIMTNPEVCKAFNDLESVGKTELIRSTRQFLEERLFDADGKRFTVLELEKKGEISVKFKELINYPEQVLEKLADLQFTPASTEMTNYLSDNKVEICFCETFQEKIDKLNELSEDAFKNATKRLNALKFGNEDGQMALFIATKHKTFQACKSFEEKIQMLEKLGEDIDSLENDPVIKFIKEKVRSQREKNGIGSEDKAERIEKAMAEIPVEERTKLDNQGPQSEIMMALTMGRITGHDKPELARSLFNQFKQQLQDSKEKAAPERVSSANKPGI